MAERGYALPLVLGVCMIISLITMAIVFSVRQRVILTQELKDRTTAFLSAHSAYNQVIYNLLQSTFTSYGLQVRGEGGREGTWWNVCGDPIELEKGVIVKLKDLGGMASPLSRPRLFSRLVRQSSDDPEVANRFVDTLTDWQDVDDLRQLNGAEKYDYEKAGLKHVPRNGHIQVMEELALLKDFKPEILDRVQDDVYYWGTGDFNYMTMSDGMLRVLFGDTTMVDQIVKLRKSRELTPSRFSAMTGVIWGEMVTPFPSSCIRVEVVATAEKAVDKITAVIMKRETEISPFMTIEWRK